MHWCGCSGREKPAGRRPGRRRKGEHRRGGSAPVQGRGFGTFVEAAAGEEGLVIPNLEGCRPSTLNRTQGGLLAAGSAAT